MPPREDNVVGLRVPLRTLTKLASEAGFDPSKIRPALRVVDRDGKTWKIRCWVLVDDAGDPMATADAGVKKLGRQSAVFKFVTGPLRHFYQLE